MGKVWFIGAGPGAPDLLTFRGARLIGGADVVIWARPPSRSKGCVGSTRGL